MSHILNTVTSHRANQGYFIPSRPELLAEVLMQLKSDEYELLDCVELIAGDVGLASKVLMNINSGFMGFNRVVHDIKQAAMLLGNERLIDIVEKQQKHQELNPPSAWFERFWDESSLVATIMEFIGDRFKEKIPLELLYSIGLFHDIGTAAIASNFENYLENLEKVKAGEFLSQTQMEEEIYHTNHAIVGYFIANGWQFPKELCKLILTHHEINLLSEFTGEQEQLCIAILKMSDDILTHNKDFQDSDDWHVVREDVCNIMGITEMDYLDLKDDVETQIFHESA